VWNGSADALLRRERDDLGTTRSGGHSGIPVRATGRHSESLAGANGPPGLRGLIRAGLPLPCQTFPACRNGGEIQFKRQHRLSPMTSVVKCVSVIDKTFVLNSL